jgi:hypothetical protein
MGFLQSRATSAGHSIYLLLVVYPKNNSCQKIYEMGSRAEVKDSFFADNKDSIYSITFCMQKYVTNTNMSLPQCGRDLEKKSYWHKYKKVT